jgi:hypothetical protein
MAVGQIDIKSLQPFGMQRVRNAVIGLDERGRLALMPSEAWLPVQNLPSFWGDYVGTYSTKTYQMDTYQFRAVMKTGGSIAEELDTGYNSNYPPAFRLRQALYEKTLNGNVFIALYGNSRMSYFAMKGGKREETAIAARGIDDEVQNIIYAFNRLIVTTTVAVCWSHPGLKLQTAKRKGEDGVETTESFHIDGAMNFKQSDVITQKYLGCHSDSRSLFLFTEGGIEVWKPTQDADSPFIYEKSIPGRVAEFCSQWCMMETEGHGMGIFNAEEEKFMTDERWRFDPGELRGMMSFWLPQNGGKSLAVRCGRGMWLMDARHGLVTWIEEAFNPSQKRLPGYMDMGIELALEKGVYASLFLQLGKFPEEIKFFIDGFCTKRAPLVAFCRDDVIKTANIGKLTADTPLELNFRGYVSIYSLGLDQPGG